MSKFWNFINNQATESQSESIDLQISGDIMSDDDSWIYEWFGIPVASPNAFRNELSQYKGKDITVWIDSYGGDVFAGAGIYNALKEHGGKVTAKITKAMSAASVIAMAAEEIQMSPVGIMMIHNPLTSAQGDMRVMRKTADVLDTVKETIINAYVAKTGRSESEISAMMDDETWMSANQAVKEGFADNVLYIPTDKAESETIMNFAFSRNAIKNSVNESLKHFIEFNAKNIVKNAQQCQCEGCSQEADDCKCSECGQCNCCNSQSCCGCSCNDGKCDKTTMSNYSKLILNNKEGKDMVIRNVSELKDQLPEIHNQVYNSGNIEGIKAERERLKAFDTLNGQVDASFLTEEKYKDGATAESVLFKAMQEGKLINSTYMNQIKADAQSANQVPGDTSDNSNPDEVTGILNFVKNTAEKTLGKGGM
ncbi:head maturation protease, ClpP-related [Clostridium sp.]|uniref:head maturation protease, ClpP-related n=1 Tax=Clostridium sp. TaxID=1506 RepID=UPI0026269DE0|nr:head maturation protease, ClpP-related [Clostridium sp.]